MKPPQENDTSAERPAESIEALMRRQILLQDAERNQKRWESGQRKTTGVRIVIALVWLVVIVIAAVFIARRINLPSAIPPPTGNPANRSSGASGSAASSAQTHTDSPALAELRASFVQIPAGEFRMGSENGSAAAGPDRVGLGRYSSPRILFRARGHLP